MPGLFSGQWMHYGGEDQSVGGAVGVLSREDNECCVGEARLRPRATCRASTGCATRPKPSDPCSPMPIWPPDKLVSVRRRLKFDSCTREGGPDGSA